MSQEEQNAKEKTIMDLQQYVFVYLSIATNMFYSLSLPFFLIHSLHRALKIAQAKAKQAQTQQQQQDVSIIHMSNETVTIIQIRFCVSGRSSWILKELFLKQQPCKRLLLKPLLYLPTLLRL